MQPVHCCNTNCYRRVETKARGPLAGYSGPSPADRCQWLRKDNTMNTLYFDSNVNDDVRRQRLYNGQLFVFSPRPSSMALCQFAREMIAEAFAPLDPREAQYSLPVEEFVAIVAPLKPRFIHHPKSK